MTTQTATPKGGPTWGRSRAYHQLLGRAKAAGIASLMGAHRAGTLPADLERDLVAAMAAHGVTERAPRAPRTNGDGVATRRVSYREMTFPLGYLERRCADGDFALTYDADDPAASDAARRRMREHRHTAHGDRA